MDKNLADNVCIKTSEDTITTERKMVTSIPGRFNKLRIVMQHYNGNLDARLGITIDWGGRDFDSLSTVMYSEEAQALVQFMIDSSFIDPKKIVWER